MAPRSNSASARNNRRPSRNRFSVGNSIRPAGTRKRPHDDSEAQVNKPTDTSEGVRPAEELRKPSPLAEPVQLSSTPPSPISRQKCPQSFEAGPIADGLGGGRPSKLLRGFSPSKSKIIQENWSKNHKVEPNEQEHSPFRHQLSEKNLKILNGEDMDPQANNTHALTRTSSRRSATPSETQRSQRSSVTAAGYRHKNLAAVKIHMHAEPPDYIQIAIDRIINAKVSKERRFELRVIAQTLRNGCLSSVTAQAGEDDFIHPLYNALMALGLRNLCTHEKADWRGELKPVAPQHSHFSSSFMSNLQQVKVVDVSAPPWKRKQQSTDGSYVSPESSMTNARTHTPNNVSPESSMMPPPAPYGSLIKTPRPDISMGIQLTALISALSSQSLNQDQASTFLTWLQNEMVQHKPDGPLEPMLIPVPAQRALDLAFPFAVVEGKAYSTGKQIFEAENQASVSGACGLKIQVDLDNLVYRSAIDSNKSRTVLDSEPPLFFSVCTQGPIHELWAHWTVVEDGVRKFGSKLIDSCNTLLLKQGQDFIVRLNNITRWGVGPFMESVVERLRTVAEMAKVE